MQQAVKRSSDTLLEIAQHEELKGELTFQRILNILGERAFGVALLFFALPSALPFSAIPGISVVFTVPIIIFACQMILARHTLWLPKIIAERTIHHQAMSKVIHTTVPFLIKIESFLKPRWAFMTSRMMEIIHGCFIVCLALLLMLPIPFSNFILAGLLILFSLGLIEKDGLLLVIGYILGLLYIGLIYAVIVAMIQHVFIA